MLRDLARTPRSNHAGRMALFLGSDVAQTASWRANLPTGQKTRLLVTRVRLTCAAGLYNAISPHLQAGPASDGDARPSRSALGRDVPPQDRVIASWRWRCPASERGKGIMALKGCEVGRRDSEWAGGRGAKSN